MAIIKHLKKEKEATVSDIAEVIKLSFKSTSHQNCTLFAALDIKSFSYIMTQDYAQKAGLVFVLSSFAKRRHGAEMKKPTVICRECGQKVKLEKVVDTYQIETHSKTMSPRNYFLGNKESSRIITVPCLASNRQLFGFPVS